jgi:ABC-2 type transport system permease protein
MPDRIAAVLPLTHGLAAIRETLASGPDRHVALLAGAEIAVGAGWLVAGVAILGWLARRSRRDGMVLFSQ